MANDLFAKLTEKYPFITLCMYASNEYMGIIQNQDDVVTTIYDFGIIKDLDSKRRFLELAMFGGGKAIVAYPSIYS